MRPKSTAPSSIELSKLPAILPSMMQDAYQGADDQFQQDIHFLTGKDLESVIKKFNRFVCTNRLVIPETLGASSLPAVEPVFGYDLYPRIRARFTRVGDIFHDNIRSIFDAVARNMQSCRKAHRLVYHTIAHAIQVSYAAGYMMEQEGYPEWRPFVQICSFIHDVASTRKRVDDEVNSAEFANTLLESFLQSLPSEDERNIVRALNRVLIVGGTLPAFYKASPDSKMQMHSVFKFHAEHGADKSTVSKDMHKVWTALRCVERADVQASLNPETINSLPIDPALQLKQSEISELLPILKAYFDEKELKKEKIKRYSRDGRPSVQNLTYPIFVDMVLTKLSQSVLMSLETYPRGETKQSVLQMKLIETMHAIALRAGVISAEISTSLETELADLSGDEAKSFCADIVGGEPGFAEMNFYTNETHALPEEHVSYWNASWNWHADLFKRIQGMAVAAGDACLQVSNVIDQLLTNAAKQHGVLVNIDAFVEMMHPERLTRGYVVVDQSRVELPVEEANVRRKSLPVAQFSLRGPEVFHETLLPGGVPVVEAKMDHVEEALVLRAPFRPPVNEHDASNVPDITSSDSSSVSSSGRKSESASHTSTSDSQPSAESPMAQTKVVSPVKSGQRAGLFGATRDRFSALRLSLGARPASRGQAVLSATGQAIKVKNFEFPEPASVSGAAVRTSSPAKKAASVKPNNRRFSFFGGSSTVLPFDSTTLHQRHKAAPKS